MENETKNAELPDKFKNHFNEMKELLDKIKQSGMQEPEFMEKAAEIGIKHFGHTGVIIDMPNNKVKNTP